MKRVLLTGMSGTGKSTVINELAARGYKAVDTDDHGLSEWVAVPLDEPTGLAPGQDWVWREDRIQELLSSDVEVLFLSGCSPNQGRLPVLDLGSRISGAGVRYSRLSTANEPSGHTGWPGGQAADQGGRCDRDLGAAWTGRPRRPAAATTPAARPDARRTWSARPAACRATSWRRCRVQTQRRTRPGSAQACPRAVQGRQALLARP